MIGSKNNEKSDGTLSNTTLPSNITMFEDKKIKYDENIPIVINEGGEKVLEEHTEDKFLFIYQNKAQRMILKKYVNFIEYI